MKAKVAIVGAGISGIAVARQLNEIANVTVFEKSRGLGGRMAARRAGDFAFDHGAQFFTARSDEFKTLLGEFSGSVVQEWLPKIVTLEAGHKTFKREWFEEHYVALPTMNGLIKAMAEGLRVEKQTRVARIEKCGQYWELLDDEGNSLGEFDWVISTAPVPQTIELLPDVFSQRSQLDAVDFSPCYALMLGFEEPLRLNFDAALVRASPLAWIALNGSKPGRPSGTSLLLHSDNGWAAEHLEDDQDTVAGEMKRALQEMTGIDAQSASYESLHRWRYARVESALEMPYLLDEENQLAACGDWCLGNRVEDAFLSGQALANALAARLAV